MTQNDIVQLQHAVISSTNIDTISGILEDAEREKTKIDLFCEQFLNMFNTDFDNGTLEENAKKLYNKKINLYSAWNKLISLCKWKLSNA